MHNRSQSIIVIDFVNMQWTEAASPAECVSWLFWNSKIPGSIPGWLSMLWLQHSPHWIAARCGCSTHHSELQYTVAAALTALSCSTLWLQHSPHWVAARCGCSNHRTDLQHTVAAAFTALSCNSLWLQHSPHWVAARCGCRAHPSPPSSCTSASDRSLQSWRL